MTHPWDEDVYLPTVHEWLIFMVYVQVNIQSSHGCYGTGNPDSLRSVGTVDPRRLGEIKTLIQEVYSPSNN